MTRSLTLLHSLFQDLRSVTLSPGTGSSGLSLVSTQSTTAQHITTSSISDGSHTVSDTLSTSLKNLLSSTDSLQDKERERLSIKDSPEDNFSLLSSYLSSTEPSLLPSMPTEESDSSSFGSTLINFAFIIIFILVSVFIVIQCSHFVVYIARQAFKNRNSGAKSNLFLLSKDLRNSYLPATTKIHFFHFRKKTARIFKVLLAIQS